MSLSGPDLESVAAELSTLVGARVQKITVASANIAAIELRVAGESAVVLFAAAPGLAHIGIVARRPPAPERSLAFQGLLRAHLTGARLDAVDADARRRMASFQFYTSRGTRRLVFEISGNSGAIALLDEKNKVLGSAVDFVKNRDLIQGRTWMPPPALEATGTAARWNPKTDSRWPLSVAISEHYAATSIRQKDDGRRRQITSTVRRELVRTRRTLEKIRVDRARIAEADVHRHRGDLLKPALKSIARGDTEALVTNWGAEGAEQVRVPLLPHLSPRENMERYYHQHKRLSRSASLVEARFQQFERDETRLARLLERIEHASDEELETLEIDTQQQVHRPAVQRATQPVRLPYRQYISMTGKRIWVGRSARDNDALTFRHARGNDLWMHARGVPGSHVIVPGCGPAGPDQDTLLDAATLAAHFSGSRGEGIIDIATAHRKYLQKPKGAAAGAVRFTQEKAVALRLEKDRLDRVLASEGQSPAA